MTTISYYQEVVASAYRDIRWLENQFTAEQRKSKEYQQVTQHIRQTCIDAHNEMCLMLDQEVKRKRNGNRSGQSKSHA